MTNAETQGDRVLFYSHNYSNTRAGNQVEALISEDVLPFDALFRLSSVGHRVVDQECSRQYPKTLEWNLLQDMITHANEPDSMRGDTRELLLGELPKAIIDPDSYRNREFYAQLDPMYYRLADLANAIKRRRADEGETLTEAPASSNRSIERLERGRCLGLARPLWRVMVQRVRPEWLENPEDYYHPTLSFFNEVPQASERTMRSRVIARTVLSDTVVVDTYYEAVETGVVNIGPSGKESLRYLLVDEHPELN